MKYFTFGLLLFFGFGVMGQVVEPNDEDLKSLTFDFNCTVEVDLKIYSVNSSTPVNDADEFITGAKGIESEDENDFIKVEFLEISGVTSGLVTLTFELKYSLNGEYYIWDESFNTLLVHLPVNTVGYFGIILNLHYVKNAHHNEGYACAFCLMQLQKMLELT